MGAQLLSYPLKAKIPLEYMIVEVMFAELFRLPNPDYIELAYGSILIELCKLQPSTMPQVLAQATELLYERLETMNVACFDRFVSWFSYHLSNFQFRWSWEDWEDALRLDPEQPKPKFIKEVLHRCLRLSYHQRVLDSIPDSFNGFAPDKPEPKYKYEGDPENENNMECMIAAKIRNAIMQKCTQEEVQAILKEIPDDESDQAAAARISIFVQTLLNMGNKSFSHSFAAIAKFHPTLKTINEGSEEAQGITLRSLFELWRTHPQMMVMLVDKMLKTQIVECAAVANWLFSREMVTEFTKCYVWEILHLTIRKMNKHVARLGKEASDARKMIEDSESDSHDSDEENKRGAPRIKSEEKPSEDQVEKLE